MKTTKTMQSGGVIKKGRPISQEAAAKKVAKGKGMISYKYPSTDAQGTGDNKGSYSKLGKESSTFGGRKVKGNSRPVMQKGGSVDGPIEARRKIMGEKKPSLKKTLNYVKKNGSGLILKDKPTQEGVYKPKMQKGGSTGKTKKYKTKNSYSELTGSGGYPLKTTVDSPSGNYNKNIEWQSYLSDTKKPYVMSVTKGGKTNEFQLSKEQAISQRKKVKKTMGFKKGGIKK